MAAASLAASGGHFRPFGRMWRAYERALKKHPLATQAVTSAALWGIGDVMAQRIEQNTAKNGWSGVDLRRAVLTAGFGAAVVAPAGHVWWGTILDSICTRFLAPGTGRYLALKVFVDNMIYNPSYVASFLLYGCLAIDRMGLPASFDKLRSDFLPTFLTVSAVWPPIMATIFAKVPVKHQLLVVNMVTILDVCFLSWIRGVGADAFVGNLQCIMPHQQQQQPSSAPEQLQQLQQQQQQPAARKASAAAGAGGGSAPAAVCGPASWRQRLLSGDEPPPSLGHVALLAASTTCSAAR